MSMRNPSHWIYSDEPSRSLSWGFFTPAGKTIDGALVNDPAIDTHSALALKSKLVPDDPAAARFHPPDTQAKHLGYFQYLIHKRRDGNKVVIEIGTVRKGHTAIVKAAKDAYKWLTTGYGSKFPVEGGVADFMDLSLPANHQYIVAYGDTFKELLAGIMEVAKGLVTKGNPAQQRNGLHHADSPNKRPEGWDDYQGAPWGFIRDKRDESGLDTDEWVDNHDTLAMQMGYKDEEGPLNHGWTHYNFYLYEKEPPEFRLGLVMASPYSRKAKSALYHLGKWEIEPVLINLHCFSFSDDSPAVHLTGTYQQMRGILTRIAKGEEPHEVKKALGIRNPANPYQDSPDISDFGMISPSGTVYSARPDEPTHAQVADRIIKEQRVQTISSGHPASVLVRQGWVRYLYNKGNALFMMEVTDIPKQMPTIRRALKSPMAGGAVMVEDSRSNYYGSTASILLARIKVKDQAGVTGRESNPEYLGHHRPYKLHGDQTTGPLTAEFHDHTKYLITLSPTTRLWTWKLPTTGERGETRDRLESILADLARREKLHTGRLGGAMKFVVFSQAGVAVGTVSAPDKDAAVEKLRGQTSKFGVRTTQSLYLYPYISSSKEIQWAADRGVKG